MILMGNPVAGSPPRQALADGAAAVARAKTLGASTPRERDYIDALHVFYLDWDTVDHWTRTAAYAQAMEQVSLRHPGDRDAALFYALALTAAASSLDTTQANRLKAAAIAEKVFAADARHPGAALVLILSYDHPSLADRGLAAARRYAVIGAPTPAGRHLPSHIFTTLGLWRESIDTNRAAVAAARQPIDKLHPLESLVSAHLQLAQDAAAKRFVDEARVLASPDIDDPAAAYALATIPARYAVERGQWSEAARVALPGTATSERFPEAAATVSFVRGAASVRTGDVATARKELEQLQALREVLANRKESAWSARIDVDNQALLAWVLAAEGKRDDAVRTMRTAADLDDRAVAPHRAAEAIVPARLLLADMLLGMQQAVPALAEFEAYLRAHPNRFLALDGAARAAELAGDRAKAGQYSAQLLKLAERADTERPEIARARTLGSSTGSAQPRRP